MLTLDERALLVAYCKDHPVAVCPGCAEALTFERVGADLIMGKRDFCPMCRADLTNTLRRHLTDCTWMRVQARDTAAIASMSSGMTPRTRSDATARD